MQVTSGVRAITVAFITLAASGSAAVAQDGGSANGGATAPDRLELRSVTCTPSPEAQCPSGGALVRGGRVRLAGNALEGTKKIIFLGGRGRRDDVAARPESADHGSVQAAVGRRARTGRVMVIDRIGRRSATANRVLVKTRPAAQPIPDSDGRDHVFPIRGRHNMGYSATNNFGGGGQRAHKGQDMFAACGTSLVAARGGRVQFAGYHSAAGYYAVIDGEGTGVDYVYMHMLKPSLVKTGDGVGTGQPIGQVGETGRATGCHLHFEMWSAPGWYEGGAAFDPLPELRRWDAYS